MSDVYYILLEDYEYGTRGFGPYKVEQAEESCRRIAEELRDRGWKVAELNTEDFLPSFLCHRFNRTISLDIYPEEYYQSTVWEMALELTKRFGPLYTD